MWDLRGRGSFSRDKKRYCGLGRDRVPDTVSCLVLVLEEQEEQEEQSRGEPR